MDLSRQLHDSRINNDVPLTEPVLQRVNWMLLAEIIPSEDTFDDFDDIECDKDHNLLLHASKYTADQNISMRK